MRIIKLALISVVILFLAGTVITLLLPSRVTILRAINIYAGKDSVYKAVSDIDRWKYWVENKDALPVSIENQDAKKIFRLGTTKAWIVSSKENQILTNWQVANGQVVEGEFYFTQQQEQGYYTVQWKFTQELKWYPWEKLSAIAADKILGRFMEAGLSNLKIHTERVVTSFE